MLPSELLNIVFRRLNTPDLQSCALVCSDFTGPAQLLLFTHLFLLPQPSRPLIARSLSVTPAQRAFSPAASYECPRSESQPPLQPHLTHPNHCAKLLAILQHSPHLAQYIRTLTVVEGRLFPHSAASKPTLLHDPVLSHLHNHAAINGPQWLASTPPQVLYSLFELIKRGRLRQVNILYPDGPKTSWSLIPRDVRNAFRFLFTHTDDHDSVPERVEIRNLSFDNPSAFSEFTSTLSNPTIRHLTLRGIKLLNAPDSQIRSRGRSTTRRDFGSSPLVPLTHSPTPLRGRQRGKGRTLLHSDLNSNSTSTLVGNFHNNNKVLADSTFPILNTLCLSSSSFDPSMASQAPETVLLLRVLLLGVGSQGQESASPLIDVPSLKNLLIPGIPIVNVQEVIEVLKESKVCDTLDTLEFTNLNLQTASLYPPKAIDLNILSNIKKLVIGIRLNYNGTICYCLSPLRNSPIGGVGVGVVYDKNHLVSWLMDSLTSLLHPLPHQIQNSMSTSTSTSMINSFGNNTNEIKIKLSCDPTTPGIIQPQSQSQSQSQFESQSRTQSQTNQYRYQHQRQLIGLSEIINDLRKYRGNSNGNGDGGGGVVVDIEMDSLFLLNNNNSLGGFRGRFGGRGKPHNHVELDYDYDYNNNNNNININDNTNDNTNDNGNRVAGEGGGEGRRGGRRRERIEYFGEGLEELAKMWLEKLFLS